MVLVRKVQVFLFRSTPKFEVLLLKREKDERKGAWEPVTGHVDRHEEIRMAAIREVIEETSCEVDPEPLAFTFTYDKKTGPRKGRVHETVYGAPMPFDEEVVVGDEHSEFGWFEPAEAREKLGFPEQQRALDALVARYGK